MIDRSVLFRQRVLFPTCLVLTLLGLAPGFEQPPLAAQTAANSTFLAGAPDGAGVEPMIVAPPGSTVTVHFFWSDPDDAASGFQLSIAIAETLTVFDDFTVSGTALDLVGVEFFDADIDNDDVAVDGDGRELVVGILLDSSPPFGGQVAGPSATPFEIGRVSIEAPATVGECGSVTFVDGLNGPSGPPISNVVIVGGQSLQGFPTVGAMVCAGGTAFVRSDCNDDGDTDISDLVFLLVVLFQGGVIPHCLEACEVNTDGMLDLADVLSIGNYLFSGGPPPAAPFPDCGTVGGTPDCDSFDGC